MSTLVFPRSCKVFGALLLALLWSSAVCAQVSPDPCDDAYWAFFSPREVSVGGETLPPDDWSTVLAPQVFAPSTGLLVAPTEVTQGEWTSSGGANPSFFADCGPDCPVDQVTQPEAMQYANTLSVRCGFTPCYDVSACTERSCPASMRDDACDGFRLPTAVEHAWIRAQIVRGLEVDSEMARAFAAQRHPWHEGPSWGATCFDECGRCSSASVFDSDQFSGIWGLIGGVGEWTDDSYVIEHLGRPTPGVLIAGGDHATLATVGARDVFAWRGFTNRSSRVGFRLVRSVSSADDREPVRDARAPQAVVSVDPEAAPAVTSDTARFAPHWADREPVEAWTDPNDHRYAVLGPNLLVRLGEASAHDDLDWIDPLPDYDVWFSYQFAVQSRELSPRRFESATGFRPDWWDSCEAGHMCGLNWYEAVWFANAASRAEQLPECYELIDCVGTPGRAAAGDALGRWDLLRRHGFQCRGTTFAGLSCPGYRLPTEAEWEAASRTPEARLHHVHNQRREWTTDEQDFLVSNVRWGDPLPNPRGTDSDRYVSLRNGDIRSAQAGWDRCFGRSDVAVRLARTTWWPQDGAPAPPRLPLTGTYYLPEPWTHLAIEESHDFSGLRFHALAGEPGCVALGEATAVGSDMYTAMLDGACQVDITVGEDGILFAPHPLCADSDYACLLPPSNAQRLVPHGSRDGPACHRFVQETPTDGWWDRCSY